MAIFFLLHIAVYYTLVIEYIFCARFEKIRNLLILININSNKYKITNFNLFVLLVNSHLNPCCLVCLK